jgi:undecaprenyl-diphosphatase
VLQSIVLGLVQGLTEFLPVSSSGHLVVVPAMAGWDDPSLTFDLVLHVGTLLAVVAVYRDDLWTLALGVAGAGPDPTRARRLALLLVVGSVPAGLAGIAFADFFEDRFDEPIWASAQLAATGVILLAAEHAAVRALRRPREVDVPRASAIGAAQAVSILPGISRSGTTIAAGLALGIDRPSAARFSFLLSIPAIAGAALTKVPDVTDGTFDLTAAVAVGFVVSTVSGYLAIQVFLRYLRTHSMRPFAYYLFAFAPLSALVVWLR